MAVHHWRLPTFTAFNQTGNDEAGMTLIEILVAMGILAAVSIAFISGMETTTMAVMTSQERLAMESLAKSQMEYVKSQDYIYVTDTNQYYQVDIPPELTAQGYGITTEKADVAGGDVNIQQVTVTVTRSAQNVFRNRTGEDTAFAIVDYKVNR
jgi:prepilin-type N-terminal cleavage/methylation domain-containing protein